MKKHIPNFLTSMNLFCGCIAIVFAFEGNLSMTSFMVGIAVIFDFADGFIARLLNVHSEIGKQLDSLADVISFGFVPAVIIYRLLQNSKGPMMITDNYILQLLIQFA